MANEMAKAMFRSPIDDDLGHEEAELTPSWEALDDEEGKDIWRGHAQAVHEFLGVGEGKELKRNAWATMVAALRGALDWINCHGVGCGTAKYDLETLPKILEAALRAAGEEVEGG